MAIYCRYDSERGYKNSTLKYNYHSLSLKSWLEYSNNYKLIIDAYKGVAYTGHFSQGGQGTLHSRVIKSLKYSFIVWLHNGLLITKISCN